MKNQCTVLLLSLLASLHFACSHRATSVPVFPVDPPLHSLQTYIIQVTPPPMKPSTTQNLINWYKSFLLNSAESRMITHIYTEAITGFAVRLTGDELREIEQKEGFLKAYEDRQLPLLTTHTPAFLGLHGGEGFWNNSNFGEGVIIGMLDTGIHPGHPSFDDDGMPAPPAKWKGFCYFNGTGCNKKIIGGRTFGNVTTGGGPVDLFGHGTHTASTAAGNYVEGANVLGNADGVAVGMAPRAHLAIYQVCSFFCNTSDVLAGMDAAMKDGVDILSLSLGGYTESFDNDVIAIGAFSAVERGIFVSCAAGNSGPVSSSVDNDSPWILTVAAGTMDRKIIASVKLGDGTEFNGESGYQPNNFTSAMFPLVYPSSTSGYCDPKSLNHTDVRGKIVICDDVFSPVEIGDYVKEAGGVAMINADSEYQGYTTFAHIYTLPAFQVSFASGLKIKSYVNSTTNPTATITFKGTLIGTLPAPTVAYFSSRGPSRKAGGILKPDILGPGVNVLAAWPLEVKQSSTVKSMQSTFNFLSGTSMAAPHLSGIAALVKSEHPDWSPARIKSAIMTTSMINSNDGDRIKDEQYLPASFFVMGAGHVNPSRAADPGLVYDVDPADYVSYLCGLGYSDKQVQLVTRHKVKCSEIKNIADTELNYPSIAARVEVQKLTVSRTVTNVGEANSTYSAKINMPVNVSVSLSPETLYFSRVNEKMSFYVSMEWNKNEVSRAEGNLVWVSDAHSVRSPIVIF